MRWLSATPACRVIAASKADLTRGTLEAPIQITEQAAPVPFEQLWTGTNRFGTVGAYTCGDWQTASNAFGGATGTTDASDYFWTSFDGGMGCGQTGRLFCFADNDALFVDGFDN